MKIIDIEIDISLIFDREVRKFNFKIKVNVNLIIKNNTKDINKIPKIE